MNRNTRYQAEDLTKLFQVRKIATMEQLKEALGTQVDVTVFRKLKQFSYRTSYSHRGRFYTLDRIARFDELGLWSHNSVYFSRHGILRHTAEVLVDQSEAGYFARELEARLHVGVKDVLRQLTRQGQLARQRLAGQYLYCSGDPVRRKQQILARQMVEDSRSLVGPPVPEELSSDEIRAALILFVSLLDEQQRRLYAGLESMKWGHGGDRKVAKVLGLDVQTVAHGRRQLLSGDVQLHRVRKPGAGRKPLEKKRRKSSTTSVS